MAAFFDRLALAYAQASAELQAIGRQHHLPHPDALVDLVFIKALKRYTQRVKKLLYDSDVRAAALLPCLASTTTSAASTPGD